MAEEAADERVLVSGGEAASASAGAGGSETPAAGGGGGGDGGEAGDAPSYPLTVVYCGVCGVPPEYCPYGPEWERCQVWIRENHPDLMPNSKGATVARAGKVSDATAGVEGLSIDESKGSDDEDEAAESRKRGSRKKKKSAMPDPSKAAIVLSKKERRKNKWVTIVAGVESFGLKPKDVAKKLGKRFATGAAVNNNASTNEKDIDVQGDVMYDMAEVLAELFDIPATKVFSMDRGRRVCMAE